MRWLNSRFTVVGFGAVVAGILAAGGCGGSDPKPTATADPSPGGSPPAGATASPAASPTARPAESPPGFLKQVGGRDVQALSVGTPIDFPPGFLLYFNRTCYACRGDTSLHRAYRDAAGALRIDRIMPEFAPGQAPVKGTVSADGATIVVEYCSGAACNPGGEPVATRGYGLKRSIDGGVTWTDAGELPPQTGVASVLREQLIVATTTRAADGTISTHWWVHPQNQTMAQPPSHPTAFPFLGAGVGVTVWQEPDGSARAPAYRLLDPSGRVMVDVADANVAAQPAAFSEGWYFTGYRGPVEGPITHPYIEAFTPGGTLERVYGIASDDFRLIVPVPGRPRQFVGNMVNRDAPGLDFRPVLIDLDRASVQIVKGLPPDAPGGSYTFPSTLVAGTFLRVTGAGTRDCLNVRDAPSTSGKVLGCYVDTVLLRRDMAVAAPPGWTAVRTLEGIAGYVASQFVTDR